MWALFSSRPFAFMGQKGDTGQQAEDRALSTSVSHCMQPRLQVRRLGRLYLKATLSSGNAVLGFLFLQQCCYPGRSEDTGASICTQAHRVVNHSHNLIKGLLQTRGEKCYKKTLNYRVPLHQYFQIRQFIANNPNLILRPLTKIGKYRLNSKNNKGHIVTGF